MKSRKQTVACLKRALKRIAKPEGWCKYTLGEKDGQCCAVGAISYSTRSRQTQFDAVAYLEHFTGPVPLALPQWNDLQSTTHRDVVSLFKRAIRKLGRCEL